MRGNKNILIDHESKKHKKYFIVNWNLGNKCNFKCSYCDDSLNSGTIDWAAPDIITGFADKIINHYGKNFNKNILFGFTGGEITLYKDLYKVLKYLKNKNCKTEILSNASQKLSYWKKMKDVLDYAILSYHSENCVPEHFFSIVEYLNKYISIHVNVMMSKNNFDKCCNLGKSIMNHSRDISISFQPLLEKFSSNSKLINYSDEMFNRIRELNAGRKLNSTGKKRYRGQMKNYLENGSEYIMNLEQYVTEKKNKWKGWMCWTGLEQIIVTQKGEVYRAWCFQDKIGNIYNDINFPTAPVICNRNSCHCNIDILSKKQKPIYLNNKNISNISKVKLKIL